MFYASCSMNIVGHQKIINFLNESIERNKIAHAYLFSGPKHLGKFTVALDFAKKIAGNSGQKINPDIIIISPEIEEKKDKIIKKDIKIEKIRELEHELGLSAYAGKYKLAIIDEAERLTIASQNALLKTLEEPPKNSVIILITENPSKLLSTIKSRCILKKFTLLKEPEIEKLINKKENSEDIIFWSLNRPGLAINLQKEDLKLEKARKAKKDLEKIFKANLSEKFSFCEELSKDFPEMISVLNYWTVLLRKNLLENSKSLSVNKKKSFDIILKIEKSLKILNETNANPRLVLENLLLEI